MIIRRKDKGVKLIYPGVDENAYLLFKNGTVKVAKTGQTKPLYAVTLQRF